MADNTFGQTLNINVNFIVQPNDYRQGGQVFSNCNAITFYNLGNKTLKIMNVIPIVSGASVSVEGNLGEEDTTNYTVQFDPTDTNPYLLTLRKIYQ